MLFDAIRCKLCSHVFITAHPCTLPISLCPAYALVGVACFYDHPDLFGNIFKSSRTIFSLINGDSILMVFQSLQTNADLGYVVRRGLRRVIHVHYNWWLCRLEFTFYLNLDTRPSVHLHSWHPFYCDDHERLCLCHRVWLRRMSKYCGCFGPSFFLCSQAVHNMPFSLPPMIYLRRPSRPCTVRTTNCRSLSTTNASRAS